jgi:hypothetical protein
MTTRKKGRCHHHQLVEENVVLLGLLGFPSDFHMGERIMRSCFLSLKEKQGQSRRVLPLTTEMWVFGGVEVDDDDGEV